MDKVRVCHMTSAHESTDQRIFYKECTSLAAAGYEVYLIAKGESREENGVHVIGLGEAPMSRFKRMTSFSKAVYQKALELNADIYHFHDPELLPYGKKLKRQGKIVIFDSHEDTLNQMTEKTWIPRMVRKPIALAYSNYAKRGMASLDALVSVTPSVCEDLRRINHKTYMVTNFPKANAAEEEKVESRKPYVCFTGGINNEWCHKQVIEALEKVSNIEYVLCGIPDSEYLLELEAEKGWKRTRYLGMLSHNKARDIQQCALAGMAVLLPSNNTGGNLGTLGNTKIFEYMENATPIICTKFAIWKDIVDKYQCGICVDPMNVQEIADAIVYLRDHPEEARQMGANGRRAVLEEFNWGTQEEKLLELYELLYKEKHLFT